MPPPPPPPLQTVEKVGALADGISPQAPTISHNANPAPTTPPRPSSTCPHPQQTNSPTQFSFNLTFSTPSAHDAAVPPTVSFTANLPPSTGLDQTVPSETIQSLAGSETTPPIAALPTSGETTASVYSEEQLANWKAITDKYDADVIKRHQPWLWYGTLWVPSYKPHPSVKTVEDVWKEYHDGVAGCLSVMELNRGWAARWKHGKGKSEWTRRNHIITLINQIAGLHPNWKADHAIRFLKLEYSHLTVARSFTDAVWAKPVKLTTESILSRARLFSFRS